jgi:hypothetical protein
MWVVPSLPQAQADAKKTNKLCRCNHFHSRATHRRVGIDLALIFRNSRFTSGDRRNNMIRTIATIVVTLSTLLAVSASASAEQRVIQTPEGQKIVHTRLAPVLMHRAVPPFLGRHVYQGRTRYAE